MAKPHSQATRVAVTLVAGGMTLAEASRIAGVSVSAIVRARKAHGLPARKAGRRPKGSSALGLTPL